MISSNAERASSRVKSSRRESFSRMSRTLVIRLFQDGRALSCSGRENGRLDVEPGREGLFQMLRQRLDPARLGQRDDASTEPAAGHARTIHAPHFHRFYLEKIQ